MIKAHFLGSEADVYVNLGALVFVELADLAVRGLVGRPLVVLAGPELGPARASLGADWLRAGTALGVGGEAEERDKRGPDSLPNS
ncbi:hypothetical protein PG984_010589 [Apiospora sp. TS-2023a]